MNKLKYLYIIYRPSQKEDHPFPEPDPEQEWVDQVYDNLPVEKNLTTSELIVNDSSQTLLDLPINYIDTEDVSKQKQVATIKRNDARVLSSYTNIVPITTNGNKEFDVVNENINMPILNYKFRVDVPNQTLQLQATQNQTYTPELPYIGYNRVEVNVPNQTLPLQVTQNQTYTPVSPYIGYNRVEVNVPQGITTNNFRQITSNNTYTLSTLYQGIDNPVAFKPDSQIEVRTPTYNITSVSNYPITQNGTGISIPIPQGYDALDSVSVDVNVNLKIKIKYAQYYSTKIDFTDFFSTSNTSISVNSYRGAIAIGKVINPPYYKIFWFCNWNSYSTNLYFTGVSGTKMWTTFELDSGSSGKIISLLGENSETVLNLNDIDNTDSGRCVVELYNNKFEFIDLGL